MASAFKFSVKKVIEYFFCQMRWSKFAGKTKHVRVVVLPRQHGRLGIRDHRRAHTLNFVRRDAHADACGANEQSHLCLVFRYSVRHEQTVVRIIHGIGAVRSKVIEADAALAKIFFELLLQLVAAVIRTDCHTRCLTRRDRPDHDVRLTLLDEPHERCNALFDLIAAIHIHVIRTADGIADVFFKRVQRVVELAE